MLRFKSLKESLGLVVLLFGLSVHAETLSVGELQSILKNYPIVEQIKLFQQASPKELHSHAQALVNNSNSPRLVQERLLYEIATLIRKQRPSKQYRETLTLLQGVQSRVMNPIYDAGRQHNMIAFPVSAIASATETDWRIEDKAELLLAGGVANWFEFLAQTVTDEGLSVNRRALAKAEQSLKHSLVTRLEQLDSNISGDYLIDIAIDQKQVELLKSGISLWSSHSLNRVIPRPLHEIARYFSTQDTLILLEHMMAVGSLKGIALGQLGRLVDKEPEVADTLVRHLADPRYGGDAARGLANTHDPNVMQLLLLLSQSPEPQLRRRSLLALKLNPDPQAAFYLQEASLKQTDPQVKRELDQ